jgi:FkbM family methyltransferase
VFETPSGPAAGLRWRITPYIQRHTLLGLVGPEVQRVLVAKVLKGWVAYHLEANLGFYTLLLAKLVAPEGRVISFEPSPAVRHELEAHVALNALRHVQVLPYAIADRNGPVHFHIADSPLLSAIVPQRHRSTITVECRTLDSLVFEQGLPAPNLIRMNIEGAEALAIAGAGRLLARHPPLLVCEVHSADLLKAIEGRLGPGWYSTLLTPRKDNINYYLFEPAAGLYVPPAEQPS